MSRSSVYSKYFGLPSNKVKADSIVRVYEKIKNLEQRIKRLEKNVKKEST